jgi:hypothetical protein
LSEYLESAAAALDGARQMIVCRRLITADVQGAFDRRHARFGVSRKAKGAAC